MADQGDVEAALVAAAAAALYPNGAGAACVAAPSARIYRGWPSTAALAGDLAQGCVNVSVLGVAGSARNATRWGVQTGVVQGQPGLGVTVLGGSASFSGVAAGDALAGLLVQGIAYVSRQRAGDTAALVAAELAALVGADRRCLLSGATVTVPGCDVVARVSAPGTAVSEWARLQQEFRVTVWAPSAGTRDAVCAPLMAGLAQIAFLDLADGTGGRLRARGTASFDDGMDAGVWRRDLMFEVEYAVTVSATLPSMLFGDLVFNGVARIG